MFASLRKSDYRLLWLTLAFYGFAFAASQVTLGWLTIELTNSAFAVAVTIAFRALPRAILSVPFGAVADRYDRRMLCQVLLLFGTMVALSTALASWLGFLNFTGIIVVAFVTGIFDTGLSVASKTYVYDMVGGRVAINGIALESLAGKLFGTFGAVTAGFILKEWGAAAVFLITSLAYICGIIFLATIQKTFQSSIRSVAIKLDIYRGITLLRQNRAVLWLMGVIVSAEIFAFSSGALLPTFAKDVFEVGEAGLGALTAARSIGSIFGLLLLATAWGQSQGSPALLKYCAFFALSLIGFASTGSYTLALLLSVAIGAGIASIDTLAATLLQHRVKDEDRGTAMGIWNLGLGMGLLGHLEVGAIAGAVGAPMAQSINAALLLLIIPILALIYRFYLR